jgi:hypothetical protein
MCSRMRTTSSNGKRHSGDTLAFRRALIVLCIVYSSAYCLSSAAQSASAVARRAACRLRQSRGGCAAASASMVYTAVAISRLIVEIWAALLLMSTSRSAMLEEQGEIALRVVWSGGRRVSCGSTNWSQTIAGCRIKSRGGS